MRIVIPVLGSFGKAGGWRVLSQLANFWIDKDHEVCFLVHLSSSAPYFPTKARVEYYDNAGKIFQESDLKYKLPKLGALILRNSLKKAIDKVSADVLLANHSFTAYPVKNSINKARKFYYIQAYEPDYYYKKTIKDFIYKRVSRNSYLLGLDMIVNAPLYLNYREIQTDKFVFPGLDMQVFKPHQRIKNSDTYILGTIGRLEEYKGTKYIIEAFKKLRRELGNKIELHIAFGEDSLSNIDGIKIFIPNGDQELASYYNSLDLYICAGTIQMDAVHYPVIEAMACKVPVLTTGYLPSDKNNSWSIPVKNSEIIEHKVKEIINSNTQDKVSKAYEDIQVFSWEHVSGKMLDFFKN